MKRKETVDKAFPGDLVEKREKVPVAEGLHKAGICLGIFVLIPDILSKHVVRHQ